MGQDPKKAAKPPVPALLLQLPGAPETWHTVDGLPGHFHPEIPTPIGDGPGEVPAAIADGFFAAHEDRVETARVAAEAFRAERLEDGLPDPGEFVEPECPVKRVEVSQTRAKQAAEELDELHRQARRELRSAVRAGEAGPQIENQAEAVS